MDPPYIKEGKHEHESSKAKNNFEVNTDENK